MRMSRLRLTAVVGGTGALLAGPGAGAAPAPRTPVPAAPIVTVAPVTPPAGAFMAGAACAPGGPCFSVGSAANGNAFSDVIAQESGGSWQIDTDLGPQPGGTTATFLNNAGCASATDCWAVGATGTDGVNGVTPTAGYITHWNGSTWSSVPSPTPGGVTTAALNEVSCASTTFCLAVGATTTGTGNSAVVNLFAEEWLGSSWVLTTGTPTTANYGFGAVSCPAVDECWTAATDNTGSTDLFYQWNGTSWTAGAGTLREFHGGRMVVNDLKCLTTTVCEVVGDEQPPSEADHAFTSQLTGADVPATTQLAPVAVLPDPDFDQYTGLIAVSCPSTDECWADGYAAEGGTNIQQSLVAHWNGSTWSTVPAQSPPGAFLQAAACSGPGACIFGGGQGQDAATFGPLLEETTTARNPQGAGTWMVASDGGIFAFGAAPFQGSMGGRPLNRPIVAMAADPATGGYWELASDGGIFAFNAPFYGSMGGQSLNQPIVGMAATPDGGGYWEVASDGGIFAFGDAAFFGSMGGATLNQPVVAMLSSGDGHGYELVASDGGIFAFGDTNFYGSMGGQHLNRSIVGMAADPATGGYWMVASDGGIFAFNAPFSGSTGGMALNRPIVGMAADPATGGYWLVASDGGIFAYNAPFYGSMGGRPLNRPIVGIAT